MTQTDRITVDGVVAREVQCCLSALVSTLAAGSRFQAHEATQSALFELSEQALELASPIDDWEEAAIQAGLSLDDTDAKLVTWEGVCVVHDIEPYQREVFEFWAVSPWLADKLEAHGEKVDRDFAGLCVWARTTSGQGIASDSVIVAIYNEMMEPRL